MFDRYIWNTEHLHYSNRWRIYAYVAMVTCSMMTIVWYVLSQLQIWRFDFKRSIQVYSIPVSYKVKASSLNIQDHAFLIRICVVHTLKLCDTFSSVFLAITFSIYIRRIMCKYCADLEQVYNAEQVLSCWAIILIVSCTNSSWCTDLGKYFTACTTRFLRIFAFVLY